MHMAFNNLTRGRQGEVEGEVYSLRNGDNKRVLPIRGELTSQDRGIEDTGEGIGYGRGSAFEHANINTIRVRTFSRGMVKRSLSISS